MLEREGDVLRLSGAATWAQAARLLQDSAGQLAAVDRVDLTGLGQVDSATLALLVAWARSARDAGRHLTFVHPPAALTSLADLYGLADFFAGA